MRIAACCVSLVMVAGVLAGCGATPAEMTAGEQQRLDVQAHSTTADFKAKDPGIDRFFQSAYAYAVFPSVTTGAFVLGGAHGEGEVFRGGKLVGYADLSQGSVGAQIGGQEFAEIVFFQNAGSYTEFTDGTLGFDARASAVAASAGGAASANYEHGVAVFTMAKGGLMLQAAIGGQKLRFRKVGE